MRSVLPLLISWVQIGEVLRVPPGNPGALVYPFISTIGLFTSLTRFTGFVSIVLLHMSLDVLLSLQYGFPRTGGAHERECGLYAEYVSVLTLCTEAAHS